MIILPAIDIINGECVRLYKGEYSTAHKVSESAIDTAKSFAKQGAIHLHTVDLDGAKSKKPYNLELICEMAKLSGLSTQVGGGIRDRGTIEKYFIGGIDRVILGSAALSNIEFVKECITNYGEKIVIGIDAKDGLVCINGWLEKSEINYIDFAKSMENIGVSYIIFTDISRDGTLNGPNLDALSALKNAVTCNIIASGGIKELQNIKDLKSMGLYGAICGKSLYSGTLDLNMAIKA